MQWIDHLEKVKSVDQRKMGEGIHKDLREEELDIEGNGD